MSRLPLTLACGDYDRTRALRFGLVEPEGIDLNYICQEVEEIFYRMARFKEFDASEMSFSSYIIRRARGDDSFIAIPVFPSRYFRHGFVFVNSGAGIERPEDLKGRRVGVPEYQITAAVWIRGFLQHDYGVRPEDVLWLRGGLVEAGRIEKQTITVPGGVRLEQIPHDRTLNGMLASGEIDALLSARVPPALRDGSGRVRRLFPNYPELERDYYRRTGIFPTMHTVVLRKEVVEAHPWVAQSLFKAFCEAKDQALHAFHDDSALRYVLPWMYAELELLRSLMGEDFWPYGLEKNLPTLEALVTYEHEQGLIDRPITVESLFAPQTLESFRI